MIHLAGLVVVVIGLIILSPIIVSIALFIVGLVVLYWKAILLVLAMPVLVGLVSGAITLSKNREA